MCFLNTKPLVTALDCESKSAYREQSGIFYVISVLLKASA